MNMPFPSMQTEQIDRYLNLLGIRRRKPDMDALRELVQAHLLRVPFENISKLYYKKQRGLRSLPGLELFLDGIGKYHFGGTCYANNFYLYQLLANLGYRIKLCGADMSNPDVHLVSIVTVETKDYLIDAGYAAPFLIPLPRDLETDFTIRLGRDRYVLKPQDESGCSRMQLFRKETQIHGYLVNPMPRQISEFKKIIGDSYKDDATFMNSLLAARFFPNRSLIFHNLNLLESQGTVSSIQTLANREELAQLIFERIGIPVEFTINATDGLALHGDAWS